MFYLNARHLMRYASIIALSSLLFSTIVIHFIHPFFHRHHHCAECSRFSAHSYHQFLTFSINEKQVISKKQKACPICSFLSHFNLYKAASYIFLEQQESLKEFPLLLKSVFSKEIDLSPARPRAPPVSLM
jgi:hypothetical protein